MLVKIYLENYNILQIRCEDFTFIDDETIKVNGAEIFTVNKIISVEMCNNY